MDYDFDFEGQETNLWTRFSKTGDGGYQNKSIGRSSVFSNDLQSRRKRSAAFVASGKWKWCAFLTLGGATLLWYYNKWTLLFRIDH